MTKKEWKILKAIKLLEENGFKVMNHDYTIEVDKIEEFTVSLLIHETKNGMISKHLGNFHLKQDDAINLNVAPAKITIGD